MAVVRVNKTKNYTVMSNTHLRDRNLSLKAKGLLSVAFSLPDDWDYSLEGLCDYCNCGRDGMKSLLKELKDCHYLEIKKIQMTNGKFEYEYVFYEEPEGGKPSTVQPSTVQPLTANPPQLNTIELNTIKQNNTPYNPPKGENDGKTKGKKLTDDVIKEEVDNRHFSPAIVTELYEWLEYKKEIKSPYSSITSFKKMLTILENAIKKHGEKAILDRMDEAMSRQWIGWNFDTMDAFDKNRPYVQYKAQTQQLDKRPKYKEIPKSKDTDTYAEQQKKFQDEALEFLKEKGYDLDKLRSR